MTSPADTRHLCPSCTRFIGRVARCPYCEADTPFRRRLVILRWAASLLGFGGVLCLLAL